MRACSLARNSYFRELSVELSELNVLCCSFSEGLAFYSVFKVELYGCALALTCCCNSAEVCCLRALALECCCLGVVTVEQGHKCCIEAFLACELSRSRLIFAVDDVDYRCIFNC